MRCKGKRINYSYFYILSLLFGIFCLKNNNKISKYGKFYKYILNPLEIEKGVYVFSALLDKKIIRIITYNQNNYKELNNKSCIFEGRNYYLSKIKAINYRGVHEKYFNLFCKKPVDRININSVVISNTKINLNNNHKFNMKYNLLICLTTLFSYNNTNRLLEFIEYYKYFGVDKFVIYITNCSKNIEKILLYYRNLDLIDLIYDNFTHNLYERKRFHVWKQNDCFHRYKYYASKIIFTDHDEIIYSPLYNSSSNLFSHLNKNASSYHFYPKLTITHGKGFFNKGYYSICPNDYWKFIINKHVCVLQVVVHDIILSNNKHCFKEIIDLEKGYIIHARNEESRHSKICRNWTYQSDYEIQNKILQNQVNNIKLLIYNIT